MLPTMSDRRATTKTSAFGAGKREGHDASAFYDRFVAPELSDDETVNRPASLITELGPGRCFLGTSADMQQLPDNSVALVVTSPPYFVGKEYELAIAGASGAPGTIPETYVDFLAMLRDVFAECKRVLEPGGRIAVNVANLGRKPYRSLSTDVITILQDDLGLLLRGEVIWKKAEASGGSCAWGSFAKASNPVLRDLTERVIIASKGRFNRALDAPSRRKQNLPHVSSISNDEFVDVTKDVWDIGAESATRVGHPAPFPIDLPRRLIDLYTYEGDLVLDPFLGSGTTIVAAARTGRIGVGYDLDPEYVELAEQRLAAELERVERADAPEPGELSVDETQDQHLAQAVDEGKKVQDIARRTLVDAGFALSEKAKDVKVRDAGLVFDFLATNESGEEWLVDVAGAFTSVRPGLVRGDAVWRLLGRMHLLHAVAPERRVLVLTPARPKSGTPNGKALEAGTVAPIDDVIVLYDEDDLSRLHSLATRTPTSR